MLLKCCTQYVSKFGKPSSAHRTGKGKFSFQYQRRTMSKSFWTTISSVHLCPTLRPHELQHARLPCPSPTPRVHSLTSIESVMPSSHLILCCPLLLLRSIFPSIRVFSSESALCISGQSIGVSASKLVLPMNTQDWSPLGWIGWISLQSKGLSRVFSNTTVQKHPFFNAQLSL